MLRILIASIAASASLAAAPVAATVMRGNVPRPAAVPATTPSMHKVYGFVVSLNGATMIIRDRTGRLRTVDLTPAYGHVRLFSGRPVIVTGTVAASGAIVAHSVWRTYPDAAHWPADR